MDRSRGGVRLREETGKYEIRWREDGRYRSKSFTRKADASAFEALIERARQTGGLVDLDRGKETLREFKERYWRDYATPNLATSTRANYEHLWKTRIAPKLGDVRLRDIGPARVERFRAELEKDGAGSPTVRKSLIVLQGMLSAAVRWERIDRNPAREVRKPSQKRSRFVRPFSPPAAEGMRAKLLQEKRQRDAALLCLLAYAGLRPSEALALRWNDIGSRSLRVERALSNGVVKSTKTGKVRTVRLLGPLVDDLEAWHEKAGKQRVDSYLFAKADGSAWTDFDWRNWRRRIFEPAAEGVGLKSARPYDLRHSFASLLIHSGQSVVEVARQMGNSPEVTLSTYAHVFDEMGPDHIDAETAIRAARAAQSGRSEDPEPGGPTLANGRDLVLSDEADARIRTADPFITSIATQMQSPC
jgi:integrase